MTRNPMDFSTPKIVRPEFGPESNVKNILKKYRAETPLDTQRPQQFTETNYDTDLTTALNKIQRANQAFDALSPEQREKYQNAQGLWRAYLENRITDDAANEPPQPLDKPPTTT